MITKVSCKANTSYLKATKDHGPALCVYMEPSLSQVLQLFWGWLTGQYLYLWHEYSAEEIHDLTNYIKHWYLVKGLQGYKRRAK